jgi:hypothetical protein
MKKSFVIYLLTVYILFSISAFGRLTETTHFYQDSTKPVLSLKSNILKVNISALVFKNISFQYERRVSNRVSVAANVHFIPFGKLPFTTTIENIYDESLVASNGDIPKLGSFGITPEMRYYIGKKGTFQGLYLAPFINYTNYKSEFPVDFKVSGVMLTSLFSGNISTLTGGLMLGAQWKLSKSFYLDWWIIGPNYGSAKGDVNATYATLNADGKAGLAGQIEQIKSGLLGYYGEKNFSTIKPVPLFSKAIDSYNVESTSAQIKTNAPWAGLRGFGLNLGFRF